MREIRFRAWHEGNGKWTYPATMIYDEEPGDCLKWKASGQNITDIMQYTELKDEDEKEVYENDIVAFAIFDYNGADTQYKGVVKFSDGQWQLWKSADDPYYGSDGPFNMHTVWYNDDGFKVIGNIYEHPHLLTQKEG